MKEKKTKKGVAPKKNGYSRIQSFCDVFKKVKKASTVEEIGVAANQVYVAHGGGDNLKEAKALNNVILTALGNLGHITIDGDKITKA